MKRFLDILLEPSLNNSFDIDGQERLVLHKAILERKRMLREVFAEFHALFRQLETRFITGQGLSVEIGAGVAMMRNSYPEILATDLVPAPYLDRTINAESMDFEDESVRVIFGQNCFHHFPHPDRFFDELNRVLTPGGGVILLEPYYGPLASFIFKRLFHTEGFDCDYPSWETPSAGPMNGANQALSYIVFVRDRLEFEKKHRSLAIVHIQLADNYLKYLLSGGLNFRQLLPNFFTPMVSFLEKILSPFNRGLALHHIIVLRKISE